jgi:hypothetical protein
MTPEQIGIASRCKLNGESIEVIGPKLGVHPSTVYRNLERPEIKALIEREAAEIINRGLKPARRTITRLAAIGNTKSNDKDMLKLSLDASKHITNMAGLSGGAPGTIINALIQVNQAPEQAKELSGIAAFLSNQWQEKSIPIEMVEIKTTDVEAAHTSATDMSVPVLDRPGIEKAKVGGCGDGVSQNGVYILPECPK